MSNAAEARRSELDADLDGLTAGSVSASELFSVVDTLDAHAALKRALSDPGASAEARGHLARSVFGPHVSDEVASLVARASERRWSSAGGLVEALDRQAVRAELKAAQADGSIDEVEDELFRLGQVVQGSPELAEALGDRRVPVADRQTLLDQLIADRTHQHTQVLARRALNARVRTFGLAVQQMLATGAELRNRALAKVTVARPLTDEQYQRLRLLLMRNLGRGVDIQINVDPAALGGMRVQVGDEVIEGTVAHRLSEARRQLA